MERRRGKAIDTPILSLIDDLRDEVQSLQDEVKWWHDFRARGDNLDDQTAHGCICTTPNRREDGTFDWQIDPACVYHATAAKYPHNHTIPWNCPTYHDGCNCHNVLKDKESETIELKAKIEQLERTIRLMSGGEWDKRPYPIVYPEETPSE